MSDDTDPLAGLPKELDYIRDVALKYGNYNGNAGDEEKTLGRLSPSQLQEIREVYQKIDQRGDTEKLSEWIFYRGAEVHRVYKQWLEIRKRGGPLPPEPMYMSPAEALFEVFEYFEDKRIKPFVSGKVTYTPPLDLDKLPAGLRYVGEAAVRWKRYQSYGQMDKLSKTITPAELSELRSLAHQMRRSGDEQAAWDWSLVPNFSENPEQELVHFFIRILREFVPTDGSPGLHEKRADDPDLDDD